jgi:septum site-determining protein MinD
VGKTTLAANLAAALTQLGQDVIVVDGNLTTPDLGFHLGMQLSPHSLHDVLKRRSRLRDAIYSHPLGFRVIPGSLKMADLEGLDMTALPEVTLNLLGRADIVILDCASGLEEGARSAIDAADEILLITNPNLPAVTETLKTLKLASREGKKILGVVVNRVGGDGGLSEGEIEDILEIPIIGEIPEDVSIQQSIAAKRPVVDFKPNSPAACKIMELAGKLCGKSVTRRRARRGLLAKLISWFKR